MVEHPNGVPGMLKGDFELKCKQEFGTSHREFERIWRQEVARTGAVKYRKTGPRGPRKSHSN
jgi:hypothetical protein